MASTFKTLFLISILFVSAHCFGQLDNTDTFKKEGVFNAIPPISTQKKKLPKSIEIDAQNGFKTAYDTENEKNKKKQEETDLKNKGILDIAKVNEERFLKNFKKVNGQYQYPKIDQDLGSFRTESASVNIICRDFQYPDGDRVTIYVNDIPVITNIVLQQQYQKFNIPLEQGVNKIDIIALNQGTSGPNTAAFKVYNDAGMLISSNEWNLATGAKATLVIAKDK